MLILLRSDNRGLLPDTWPADPWLTCVVIVEGLMIENNAARDVHGQRCRFDDWISGEQFSADFAAIDNFDWSIAWGHQFLVGDDAEAVVDGGCPVFNVERVIFGFAGG